MGKQRNPKDKALRLLAFRDRTRAQLQQRMLRDGYAAEEIEPVLVWLADLGYLNDRRFAENWVASRNRQRITGNVGLRYELKSRGVNEYIIEDVLNTPEEEWRLARILAEAKWTTVANETGVKGFQRVVAFLKRRGFDGELCLRVGRELAPSSLDTDP